ncbi:hypothetical protein AJ80_00330 [Polytolypa hystricis UAMH7299]|uniref:Uncharacterized protein n=1 Tax=Polytolypa hystricis (strain UAMH7299) TaxID=1447883 RepID=A0A2B7YVG1_POLH7|nr:hypothetical protein AJ80_00330 [Polytolypa hystricis UAMH7299]
MTYEVPPTSEIEPGLFIGDIKNTYDEAALRDNRVHSVVSLIIGGMSLWPKFTRHVGPGRHL